MKIKKIDITDIEGFRIGNAEDPEGGTGCTVIISEEGAVAGVDVRGGGPATRETDLLKSENTVETINAVVLSGGSAFGLEAASGVMRALAERGIGFKVGNISVPIVSGASLFDLAVGRSDVFPDREMGVAAANNAYFGTFKSGNHGAGTGASVGKMLGMERAMKSGLGTFACGDGVVEVGAIAAVNACADIYNGAGNIIAGLRTEDGSAIYGTIKVLKTKIRPEPENEIRFEELKPAPVVPPAVKVPEPAPAVTSEPVKITAPDPVEDAIVASDTDSDTVAQTAAGESLPQEVIPEPEEPKKTDFKSEIAKAIADAYEAATKSEELPEPVTAVQETAADSVPEITEEPAEPEEPVISEPEAEAEQPAESEEAEPEAAAEPEIPDPYELSEEEKADMGYDIPFNTTIGCLITNAIITKSQANKLASILHDAYARAIKPVHSTLDGDTIFVMSTCKHEVNFDAFAALATDVMQYAIIDGAHQAERAYGLPAARDMVNQ